MLEVDTKKTLHELELTTLFQISGIIGQLLDLDHALESILEILSRSLSMERATVTLRDPTAGLLRIRACHGLSEDEKQRGIYHSGEGVTGTIFSSAQPFVVPDIGNEPLFLNKTQARDLRKESLAFIGVPILLQGEPVGVLSVDRLFGREVGFEEDIRFLTILAGLIAQFVAVNREVEKREKDLMTENRFLKAEVSEKYNHFFAVGVSPAMQDLKQMIAKVSPSNASVLLLGESGTGKTLTARIIHEMSGRARGPFIKVNCASLPDNLIESELFSYEKGAFTGATETKRGRFEDAETGSIFLDEIGELPMAVQSKLLRFLQDHEFERLGSTRTRRLDVRIIAATNQDLSMAVQQGRFRSDLFYRLNVFPVAIPPLRERRSDVPLLANYFLEKTSKAYGRRLSFAPNALEALLDYAWPGNVRELENLIERLAIMADGRLIERELLPAYLFPAAPKREAGGSTLESMERQLVIEALERNGWVQQRAARDIGLTMRQMGYRVKKFGLDAMIRQKKAAPAFSG
jgi:Nif-specific regulatory protein